MKGRIIYKGRVRGEALVTQDPISFFGGIDPKTGVVIDRNHELFGKNIAKKILVFPKGKGSTVGSYVIYQLKKNRVAPLGMINIETEPIVAVGAIIAEIPLVDRLEKNPIEMIKTGKIIEINGDEVNITR